jgi:hypothetical protein
MIADAVMKAKVIHLDLKPIVPRILIPLSLLLAVSLLACTTPTSAPTVAESPSPTKTVPSATSEPVPSTDTPTSETKVKTKPSPTEVINWDQSKDYIGASISVCGPVVGTSTDRDSQGNPTHAYLYIGKSPPDPDGFVVKIPGRIRNEFANRDPENYYLGKDICVTGLIKKGPRWSLPMISVEKPTQIE